MDTCGAQVSVARLSRAVLRLAAADAEERRSSQLPHCQLDSSSAHAHAEEEERESEGGAEEWHTEAAVERLMSALLYALLPRMLHLSQVLLLSLLAFTSTKVPIMTPEKLVRPHTFATS